MHVSAVSERRMVRMLWLVLLASIIGLFPFTIFSTFLVPISDAAGSDTASVGALRGFGGVAALAVGIGFAPLVGRIAKHRTSAAALALLAAASVVATHGSYPALLAFCLGIGSATAVLTPSLLATAADRFPDDATSARAATMVTAVTSLAAVLAGPVIGAMAWWRGWQGALIITAALALFIAVFLALRSPDGPAPAQAEARASYRAALRALMAQRRIAALVAIAMLRTAAFMGCLAYLAAVYDDRFGLDARTFTLVWTLSGASFFTGNLLAGRWANTAGELTGRPRRLVLGGLVAALVAVVAVFHVTWLPAALAATSLMGLSHAVVAAGLTTLIVRSDPAVRGPALSLNAAGMSLGVFFGAALGGAGLAVAGYSGIAVTLAALTAVALVIALAQLRR